MIIRDPALYGRPPQLNRATADRRPYGNARAKGCLGYALRLAVFVIVLAIIAWAGHYR